jgi:hypothetical protein
MRKPTVKVFTLLALWASAGLVLADNHDIATLNQISGYRQWTRVSKKPVEVKAPDVDITRAVSALASAGA